MRGLKRLMNDPSVPPRIADAEGGPDGWPIYFAREPLNAPFVQLQIGDPFPLQRKDQIAGLGNGFGVPDADKRPFHELPFVGLLRVPSRKLYDAIVEAKCSYKDAVERVDRYRATQPTVESDDEGDSDAVSQ